MPPREPEAGAVAATGDGESLVGVAVALPACQAVATPTPNRVQAGVKRALMALVLLDATLATALAGTVGLVILVLMVPTLYLNRRRWLYAT